MGERLLRATRKRGGGRLVPLARPLPPGARGPETAVHEHTKTVRYEDLSWLPPVETADELQARAEDDQVCYVKQENAVYRHVGGVWIRELAKGDPEPV